MGDRGILATQTLRGEAGVYQLYERKAAGAFGSVYFGISDKNVPVAVKRLHPHLATNRDIVNRFEREAALVRDLKNPHIVRMLDHGRDADGIPFLVMEWVKGLTIDGWLDQGKKFAPAEVAAVAAQVLEGLQAAWEQGVVHRDIKPANVMVTPDDLVMVMDFGVAKGGAGSLTADGSVIGTWAYMSPEQFRGQPLDGRADLYALGVTLYAMLTGQPPYPGPDFPDFMRQHLQENPPPLAASRPDVPPGLAAVILKSLAKQRDDRFSSPEDMLAAVRPFAREYAGTIVRPAPPAPAETLVRGDSSPSAPPLPTQAATRRAVPLVELAALPRRQVLVVVGVAIALVAVSIVLMNTGLWPFKPAESTARSTTAAAINPVFRAPPHEVTRWGATPEGADGYRILTSDPDVHFASVDVLGPFDEAVLFTADASLSGATANRFLALTCRDQPGGGSGYWLKVIPSTGTATLAVVRDGTESVLAEQRSSPAASPNQSYRLELRCVGDTITGRINNGEPMTARDTTYPRGMPRFGAGTDRDARVALDAHFKALKPTLP